jgi:hypothetical protein
MVEGVRKAARKLVIRLKREGMTIERLIKCDSAQDHMNERWMCGRRFGRDLGIISWIR